MKLPEIEHLAILIFWGVVIAVLVIRGVLPVAKSLAAAAYTWKAGLQATTELKQLKLAQARELLPKQTAADIAAADKLRALVEASEPGDMANLMLTDAVARRIGRVIDLWRKANLDSSSTSLHVTFPSFMEHWRAVGNDIAKEIEGQ